MRKRIVQICILAVVLGAIVLFANVIPAIAMAESKWEAILVAQELAAKERAAEAWAELESNTPELHMGCVSTVSDVIGMGLDVGIELAPLLEELLEEDITLNVGTLYSPKDWLAGEWEPVIGDDGEVQEPFLVCVDAGHLGGYAGKPTWKNTGAQSVSGEIEHAWSIKVAYALRDELLARGYEVYMVRDTDDWSEFPYDLDERTAFINEMECDITVAIHWDSMGQSSVNGYHTIYMGTQDSPNYRLAKEVSDAYGEALKGAIKKYTDPMNRDDLLQMRRADMPITIVECGFSSNPSDSAWLENENNFAVIAQGIANGVDNYFAGEKNNK